MNRTNLQKMADYIKTIKQEVFSMENYRNNEFDLTFFKELKSHKCNTVGCVIGHCIELDSLVNIPLRKDTGDIDFTLWSEQFTGLSNAKYAREWAWCFSGEWYGVDNTPEGASRRIEYLLRMGLPENWRSQMMGNAPLSYMAEEWIVTEISD